MSERRPDPSADGSCVQAARRHAWSSADLHAFALIDEPVWVQAVDATRLLWGNAAAARFWSHADPAALAGGALPGGCSAALRPLAQPAATPIVVLNPDGRPRAMHCRASRIELDGVPAILVHARPAEPPQGDRAARRAQQVLQHADLPVSLYDDQGRVLFRNPAAEQAFGGADEHGAITDLAATFADPADLARLRAALAEVGTFSALVPVWTRLGASTHLVDAKAVRDPDDGAAQILISQRDCTMQVAIEDRLRQSNAELARMTAELQQSEARLHDFAVCGSDWFYELDEDLRFSYMSDVLDSVTGEDRLTLIGQRPMRDGLLDIDDATWAAHQADLAAHRPIRDFRFGRAGADGRTRTFSISAQPVIDGDGTFRGYRGVGRDVTATVDAERFLRAVLDAFPGAVNVKTADRRFVFMNAFQANLHGIAASEATGKTVAELHGPHYDPAHAGNDARVIATGEPVGPYLGILRAADGKHRDWLTQKVPLKDRDGRVTHIVSAAIDITAQKETERALEQVRAAQAESEARFRDFAGASSDWFWEQDENLRFTFVSRSSRRSPTVSAENLIGKTRRESAPEGVSEAQWAAHDADLAARRPFANFEFVRTLPNGSHRHLSISGVPVFDAHGTFKGYRGTGTDITERVEAEEAARASEARFRDFAESASDWFWEQDEEGRFTFLSESIERMTGIPAEAHYGKRRRDFRPADDRDDAAWAAYESALAARQPIVNFRVLRVMPDGKRRHLLVNGKPFYDSAAAFRGYRGTGTDVTALVEAEQALRTSEQRFKDFASATGHYVWEADAEGRLTFIDDGYERIYGVPGSTYLGTRPQDRPTAAGRDLSDDPMEVMRAKRLPFKDVIVTRRHRDGHDVHLSMCGKPIFDADGTFMGYRGTGSDVTAMIEAQRALALSEQRFRDFASAASHWVWESDRDHRFRFATESIDGEADLAISAVMGRRPDEVGREDIERQNAAQHILEVMGRHVPFMDMIVPRRLPDGATIYQAVSGRPIFDETGAFTGYRGTARDVTPMVEAQKALQASEQRFRDFASAAGHYVWESDADGRLTFLGEGYERVIGIMRSEVLGTSANERPPDAGRDRAIEQVDLMRARREPFMDLVVTRRRRDGRDVHISVSGKPIFDADGTFKGYRGVNRDVTDLVKAQAALKASEQRFRDFASAAGHWVWETDAEDRVSMVGDGFEHVTGVPGSAVIGKRAYAVDRSDPLRVPAAEALKRTMQRREPFMDVVIGWSTRDGKPLSLALSAKPVFDDDGAFQGFRGVTRDVTAQLAAEAEAERFRTERDLAAGADRAKTQFLANMSHELRTPLNAIIGFSEIMVGGLFGPIANPRYAAYAGDINKSAQHLLDVINDLLDMSRIELNRREIDCDDASLDEIVQEAVAIAGGIAQQGGLRIEAAAAATGLTMFVDKRAIKQILVNLLSNAVKFTKRGGTIALAAGRRDDGTVVLTVRDSGIGIPERELPTLFEAFAQSDARKARGGGGAGLGLWISRALARLHGGDLTIASAVGHGTTATLTLPGDRLRRSGGAPPRRAATG